MYDVYLDKILLPVTPGQIRLRVNNQNRTLTLINDGEINILKKAGLSDIVFTALLPQQQYPFARYKSGFAPAVFFLDALRNYKTSQEPFQFKIFRMVNGRLLFDTNITVSLEDYEIDENAVRNGFDITVIIRLKEYRGYSTHKKAIVVDGSNLTIEQDRPAQNPPQARSHTVIPGDSLWAIARRYLNDGSRWPELQNLNPQIAQRNLGTGRASYTIFPGQVINLPSQ